MRETTKNKTIKLIGCIVLALVYLSPIFILLTNSFKTQKGIYLDSVGFPKLPFLTFKNYPEAIERMGYLKALTNSLLITIISTAVIVIFTSMAAWVLVRYKTKLSSILFLLFASAMLIPFQCVMLPLVRLMSQLGLQNPPGLIFMYLGFGASLSIILYHGFIKGIPLELEEAATIDGCGMFKTYWVVVFPLLLFMVFFSKNLLFNSAFGNTLYDVLLRK